MRDTYGSSIEKHNLANEIICTGLVNYLSADMGITFFYVIKRELEVSVFDIVRAYVAVINIFSLQPVIDQIDFLAPTVDLESRHFMRSQVANLIRRSVRWLLHFCGSDFVISEQVERFAPLAKELVSYIKVMPINTSDILQADTADTWIEGGVDASFAKQVAGLNCNYHAFNICSGAQNFDVDISRFSQAYFFAFSHLGLELFREKIDSIRENNSWAELISYSFKQDLDLIERNLANKIISMPIAADVEAKFNAWVESVPSLLEQWKVLHNELNKAENIDSAIIVMGIRILQKLVDA